MAKNKKKQRLANPAESRKFLTWTRVVRYGLRNFTRNAWLSIAATVVMVITLLIILIAGIANSVLSETINDQRQKMDLSFYIKSNASDDTLRNLMGKLRVRPNVSSISISTSENEYKIASRENPEAYSQLIEQGVEPHFPAVIHVKLLDMNKRADLEKFVRSDKQFKEWIDNEVSNSEDISTRQNTIDKLANVMNYAGRSGLIASIIFVTISVLIIFNTIRMTIFSRREEISMMRSIGADDYFIRGPFLVEAQLYGLIAAIIAMAIAMVAQGQLLHSVANYINVTDTQAMISRWWPLMLLVLMVIGFAIGDISARLALRRYLKVKHK